jgi:glycosyltransferase involved in cell wall biosynthesis
MNVNVSMTPLPLVSINIPAYNQAPYIRRAIESALAQDYPKIEIVVSDDRSTDDTFDIATTYAARGVRVHRTARNCGRVENYRRLLYELSSGAWAVNLDGDDYYDDPTFVSGAIARIASDPNIVMYAAGAKALTEATGRMVPTPMALDRDETRMSGVDYVLRFPKLGATQHFAVLYNRALAMDTGFYTLDSLGTDTDSLLRLALRGEVLVHRKYVGVWTHHAANASYSLTDATLGKEIRMLEHVADALAAHVPLRLAQRWLTRNVRMKRQLAAGLTLRSLPLPEAFAYYRANARPGLFYAKEGVKLALRSLGVK